MSRNTLTCHFYQKFSFRIIDIFSIWQGIPCTETYWRRCWNSFCHEGVKKGNYSPEKENNRAYENGATSSSNDKTKPVFGNHALCISNSVQTPSCARLRKWGRAFYSSLSKRKGRFSLHDIRYRLTRYLYRYIIKLKCINLAH